MTNRRNVRTLQRHRAGLDHPSWDDVRCYRCGRWRHPQNTGTSKVDSAIGTLTVAVCSDADECLKYRER